MVLWACLNEGKFPRGFSIQVQRRMGDNKWTAIMGWGPFSPGGWRRCHLIGEEMSKIHQTQRRDEKNGGGVS